MATTSPFPGMDPYLEPHWLDVHGKLAVYTADDLNERLPADLAATTEERVAVESREDRPLLVASGVFAESSSAAGPGAGAAAADASAGVTVEAPFRLQMALDPITERFVRVVTVPDGRLVAVIEYVSPTNKRNPGLRAFRRKRAELLASGAHVVEIDLVRAGDWRALMRPDGLPAEAESTYRAVIRTGAPWPGGYLFPIRLREPLPAVPIPLRPGDPPVTLDLRKILDAVYARGRYAARLRYDRPLRRPLPPDDAGWAGRPEGGRAACGVAVHEAVSARQVPITPATGGARTELFRRPPIPGRRR